MFCPNCGSQIPEGGAFCASCGTNVAQAVAAPAQAVVNAQAVANAQMQQFQAQKTAVRQSEIAALEGAYQYFAQKSSVFEEYDLVCDLVNDYAGGAKSSLLVWGCIITTFGLIACLSGPEAIVGCLLALVLPGIAMMVGGILMKVNNRKKYAYFQDEYARLSQELYDYYVAYPNCPVGAEYANPEILSLIMGVLQSGRADTIKESINLLIAEADQAEVNEYLAMIEQNTQAINAQTKVAAVFAAANFFK